ncbi:MAG: hypothetical protein WC546_06600 [Candidatus Omnitrophota bacterium]
MRNKFFYFLLLSFTVSLLAFPEGIKLKNGKSISAKIIEKSEKFIRIDIDGIAVTYYTDEIKDINGKKIVSVAPQKISLENNQFENRKKVFLCQS